MPGKASPAKIITFSNLKGGSGKTTIAQNLAACFALVHRQRVLAIDLDPQGNLGQGLFDVPTASDRTASRWLIEPDGRYSDYAVSVRPGLDLILNRYEAETQGIFDSIHVGYDHLRTRLADALDRYDYIFVDTPAGLPTAAWLGLEAAEEVVLVVSCGVYDMTGTLTVKQAIREFFARQGRLAPEFKIVLNRYDERRRLDREIQDALGREFRQELMRSFIRPNIKIGEAAAVRLSVYEYNQTSLGATDLKRLSREMLGLPLVEETFDPQSIDSVGMVIPIAS